MRVQEVLVGNNQKGYVLVDGVGVPVLPVMKYMKYLDATGKSSNTQKTYCYAIKLFFDFLQVTEKDYKSVSLEDLVDFMSWMRNPFGSGKTIPLQPVKAKRTEKTINLTMSAVKSFYDYLYKNGELQKDTTEMMVKESFIGGGKAFKDFLHHVNKRNPSKRNLLKRKEPRKRLQVLTKEEVGRLVEATTNIRDRLLIHVLFEAGLRIGEVLALFIEDFKLDHKNGHRIRLVDRGELENGAKLKTGEREIHVSQGLMDLYDDYLYEILDDFKLEANFLFVKLRGDNIGKAMNYQDVSALFKRLRKKTGIPVHPHLLRHSHATLFYKQTKDIKQVQERLGHSQIQTTINFYLHPSDEEIRENWERARRAFEFERS